MNISILNDIAEQYYNRKREIDLILEEIERNIRDLLSGISDSKTIEEKKNILGKLFVLQTDLYNLVYKYDYPVNKFISNFVYEFDRQDNESIDYLIREIENNTDFLID